MKHLVSLGVMIFCLIGAAIAQTGTGVSIIKPSNEGLDHMADILPPPPNASSIAKYGGLDIDLVSGCINKSLSLKSLTDRDITVPVSLNYISNGLKVNDYPSRVGMGWTINVGGQISRVIHGRDDLISTRYIPNFLVSPNDEDMDVTRYAYKLVNEAPTKDAEPDIFSFNFGNYSGKFFFDEDGIITPIQATNLKFAYSPLTNNPWKFTITTPDGIKYFFGGTGAEEKTKFGPFSQHQDYQTTVWYLYKIEHPSGYSTQFVYDMDYIESYLISRSQTLFKLSDDNIVQYCATYNQFGDKVCMDGTMGTSVDNSTNMFANVALVKEINTSTGSKITFNYSVAGYPEKIINSISYFNDNEVLISKYKFEYTMAPTPSNYYQLPFLVSILETNSQDVPLNKGHFFEYINLNDLPDRVSFSQDHWGYYNGKNNTTLIPTPEDVLIAEDFPQATADRNMDPNKAKNGLLSKIYYPTGGNDVVEYEPNIVIRQKDMNPYVEVDNAIDGGTSNSNITNCDEVYNRAEFFNITYEHRIKIITRGELLGTATCPGEHQIGKIQIVNTATNDLVLERLVYIETNPFDKTEYVDLPSGSYELFVYAKGPVRTTCRIRYRSGTAPNMQDVNEPVGGMRVKKTFTFDGISNQPVIKRYYYSTFNNLNGTSIAPFPDPVYYTPYPFHVELLAPQAGFTFFPGFCTYLISKTYNHKALYSNSLTKTNLYDNKLVQYSSVIESIGGDNFENGAIEHKYDIVADIPSESIRGWYNLEATQTNDSYLSKGEIETNIYAKRAGNLIITNSTIKEITFDPRKFKRMICFNVHQANGIPCTLYNGQDLVGPVPLIHYAFHINKYYITASWKYLSQETIKTYDQDGLNPIVQTTSYGYDNVNNLLLTRTQTLNSRGELIIKETKYPHDFTGTSAVCAAMISKNIINTPIETKTFIKTGINDPKLLLTEKMNYSKTWFSDNHLIALDNVEIQKEANLSEQKFKYYAYNTYGKPLEFSKTNDGRQSIIWDYKGVYPVAKVLNSGNAFIAYTSFEADGKGNWLYSGTPISDNSAPTGKMIYVLSGSKSIQKTDVNPSQIFFVTYWSKNASAFEIPGTQSGYPITGRTVDGWHYYEHKVTGHTSIEIRGSGRIDELRLYPDGAMMTTCTYEPQIGMTSQCDANNKISYYEYDAFNRLSLIRDQDKNILKKICYNYTGMAEDCPVDDQQPQWVFTGQTRCQPCPDDNSFPSNIREHEEKDINPHSQSINATRWVSDGPGTCVSPAHWKDEGSRCELNTSDENTGNQVLSQRDNNPCSSSYDQVREILVQNTNACPVCSVPCQGPQYKCIDGVCQTGVWTVVKVVHLFTKMWACYYAYCFSNGSISNYHVIVYSSNPCNITCP